MLWRFLTFVTSVLAVTSATTASDVAPTCQDVVSAGLCSSPWVNQALYCAQTCKLSRADDFPCHDRPPYCSEVKFDNLCGQQWQVQGGFCAETCGSSSVPPQTIPTTPSPAPTQQQQQKQSNFYVGVNTPWVSGRYGWHFGNHKEWGRGYVPDLQNWASKFFKDLDDTVPKDADLGLLARLFVFGDLRGGLDMQGDRAIAIPDQTLSDIVDFLDRAKGTRVKLVLSLVDFHVCDEHCAVLWDEQNTQAFVNNIVVPLLQRIAGHPSVFAIEPMNEPEWAVRESGRAFTKQQLSAVNLQRYSALVNAAVKKYTAFLKMDGSASPMWKDFWTDDKLQGACPECGRDAVFDWVQTHMYSFSKPDYDVFAKGAGQLFGNGKRVLIGEVPGKDGTDGYTNMDRLQKACQGGYAGVLFWSYGAEDGVATWSDIQPTLAQFKTCTPRT